MPKLTIEEMRDVLTSRYKISSRDAIVLAHSHNGLFNVFDHADYSDFLDELEQIGQPEYSVAFNIIGSDLGNGVALKLHNIISAVTQRFDRTTDKVRYAGQDTHISELRVEKLSKEADANDQETE